MKLKPVGVAVVVLVVVIFAMSFVPVYDYGEVYDPCPIRVGQVRYDPRCELAVREVKVNFWQKFIFGR